MKKLGMDALDKTQVAARTILICVDVSSRLDHTQSEDADAFWIKKCVPMLRQMVKQGAKVVVLACQDGAVKCDSNGSLRPSAQRLEQMLGTIVKLVPDVCGSAAQYAIRELWPGDVLLLDDMCFMVEDQAKERAVHTLSPLIDYCVCD